MSLAACLLATVTTLGSAPEPPSAAELISYRTRVVTVEGLEWRTRLADRMTRIGHNGPATVWTASSRFLAELPQGSGTEVVQAPRAVGEPGATLTVKFGGGARIDSNEAPAESCFKDHRAACARDKPASGATRDVLNLSLVGRKLDQGILAHLEADDTHVSATHEVGGDGASPLPEVNRFKIDGEWLIPEDGLLVVSLGAHTVADRDGKAVVLERLVVVEAAAIDPNSEGRQANAIPTTPEGYALQLLGEAECEGELSPAIVAENDAPDACPYSGVMNIRPDLSGPFVGTTAKADKARRKYKDIDVNVSEASTGGLNSGGDGSSFKGLSESLSGLSERLSTSFGRTGGGKPNLPIPTPPGRSLPAAVAPDGSTATLPPLPVDAAEDDADESAEPRPSPQARAGVKPACVDKDARTVSGDSGTPVGKEGPFDPAPEAVETTENFTFRLPLGRVSMRVRVSTTRGRVERAPAK